ncbi:hypothetical protein EJC49_08160 [Aquibium carbonis]|uniref:Metallo-beta-lactamase superfamily protein n=1 Tax=Aquibium carbonis TaxID=2495581 RepID=A0A429YZM8_9HYPH|nr:hypothetical protein [Aquibium carbonis]RST86883.1 hypothetical protein EJC49_08160 [Aquibium carbonis]
MNRALVAAVFALLSSLAASGTLHVQPVTDGVWAIVGEKEQRSAANLANNATFGLLETEKGAVLIDPGGSWKGSEAQHEAIRAVTDQQVVYAINTGGPDHRWLGNGYWQAQGAAGGDILAAPKVDQSAFAHLEQFEALAARNAQTAYRQMEWE